MDTAGGRAAGGASAGVGGGAGTQANAHKGVLLSAAEDGGVATAAVVVDGIECPSIAAGAGGQRRDRLPDNLRRRGLRECIFLLSHTARHSVLLDVDNPRLQGKGKEGRRVEASVIDFT